MSTRRPKVPRTTDGGSASAQATGSHMKHDADPATQRTSPRASAGTRAAGTRSSKTLSSGTQSAGTTKQRTTKQRTTVQHNSAQHSTGQQSSAQYTTAHTTAQRRPKVTLLDEPAAGTEAAAARSKAANSNEPPKGSNSPRNTAKAGALREKLAAPKTTKRPASSAKAGAASSTTKAKPVAPNRKASPNAGAKSTVDPRASRAQQRSTYSRGIRKGAPAKPASPPTRPPRGGANGAAQQPTPARTFSGRIIALVLVLITAVVFVTPAFRVYMEQQSEIADVNQTIADEQRRQDALNANLQQWQDQNFVVQQARGELNMVNPGERQYIVNGADAITDEAAPPAFDGPTDLPWADAFWESVKRAATAP